MKKILSFIFFSVLICITNVSCKKAVYENDGHEHTYSDQWTFDDNYHWKKAVCNGAWDCKVRIAQKGSHRTSPWIPDTDLIESTGNIFEKNECSVCGKKQSRKSDFPVFEAVDSKEQGVSIKFYLPNNTHQITILKSTDNKKFVYYSRLITWEDKPFSEKDIIWNDPFVEGGKDYYYFVRSAVSNNGTMEFSGDSDIVKIKSKGGSGELFIKNKPEGYFDESTNTLVFTTLPEYSIPECKTRILFNTANNNTWWTGDFNATSKIPFYSGNWPFNGYSEMDMKSFGITGDITYSSADNSSADNSWPYSGKGEVFYRTMEGGIILDQKDFTWKRPQ